MTAKFIFWDVQHGHATYVKSPNDRHVVVDLGTGSFRNGESFSPLAHLYHHYGVRQIDYGIVTHPHLDHIDDIENFDAMNPKAFCRPKHIPDEKVLEGIREKDRHKFEKYVDMNRRYNQPILDNDPDNPRNPDNYGGLVINKYKPHYCSLSNLNNHSVVTVFQYAESKVIVPGDNESCSWEELLNQSDFRKVIKDADVLLAPHHGRESGWHDEAMNLINPSITVISDNRREETTAQPKYSKKSRGWEVQNRSSGRKEFRKTVSTYNDGVIVVKIGRNSDASPFLEVRIGV